MQLLNQSPEIINFDSNVREKRLHKILSPTPEFLIIKPEHTLRADVENYIADKFSEIYQASINEFMPLLLSMQCLGSFSGVAGMRLAGEDELFLEVYLDERIEVELETKFSQSIERNSVVEIGNLVATAKGASHIVFLMFTSVLYQAGYEWIVFTANSSVKNNLDKLGFITSRIKSADCTRLSGVEKEKWGSYYDVQPEVVVGSLENAMDIINKSSLFRLIKSHYQSKIDILANELIGR